MEKFLLFIINGSVDDTSTYRLLCDFFDQEISKNTKFDEIFTTKSLKISYIYSQMSEMDCDEYIYWDEIGSSSSFIEYFEKMNDILSHTKLNTNPLTYNMIYDQCVKLMHYFGEYFVDMYVFLIDDNNIENDPLYMEWFNEISLNLFYVHGANLNVLSSNSKTLSLSSRDEWKNIVNFDRLINMDDFIEWLESDILWRGVLRRYSSDHTYVNSSNSNIKIQENVATLYRVDIVNNIETNMCKLLKEAVFPSFGIIHYGLKNELFIEKFARYDLFFQLQFEDHESNLETLLSETFFLIELHFNENKRIDCCQQMLWPQLKSYFDVQKYDDISLDPRLTNFNSKLYCLAKKYKEIEIRCYPLDLQLIENEFTNFSIDDTTTLTSPSILEKVNNISLTSDYKILKTIETMDNICHPENLKKYNKTLLKCASFNSKSTKKRNSILLNDISTKITKFPDNFNSNEYIHRRHSFAMNTNYEKLHDMSCSSVKTKNRVSDCDRKLLTQIEAILQRKYNMETNSSLYKNCRKKLFLVCKTFVNDLDETSSNFISDIYRIVKDNVNQVVKFESSKSDR